MIKEKVGSTRTITKFLFFPKMIDWKIKWLKTVTYKEKLMLLTQLVPDSPNIQFKFKKWVGVKWM